MLLRLLSKMIFFSKTQRNPETVNQLKRIEEQEQKVDRNKLF